MRHLPLSVIAGVVVALAVAPAAVAVPFDDAESIRIEPYTWTFTSEPLGVASASYSMGGVTYSDAWDSSTFSVWSEDENNEATLAPTEFGCASFDLDTSDPSGDAVLRCDEAESAIGLTLGGEVRLYAAGDLVRTLYVVTNPTASPITFSYSYTVDFFGGQTLRATTSSPTLSADAVVTADDEWVYNAQPTSLNSLVAWGLPTSGAPVERAREWDTSTVALINDRDVDGEQIAVQPGTTIAFAFFHKLDPTGTTASRIEFGPATAPAEGADELSPAAISSGEAIADATAEFATFDGRLSAGLADDLVVANWQPLPAVDDEAPELAETGSNSTVVIVALLVGGTLLGLGVVLLVARRLRRSRSSE